MPAVTARARPSSPLFTGDLSKEGSLILMRCAVHLLVQPSRTMPPRAVCVVESRWKLVHRLLRTSLSSRAPLLSGKRAEVRVFMEDKDARARVSDGRLHLEARCYCTGAMCGVCDEKAGVLAPANFLSFSNFSADCFVRLHGPRARVLKLELHGRCV